MKTKPTRKFTPEEKLKYIKEYFNENISQHEITRRYGVPNSTFRKWLGFYENHGEEYFYSEHRGRKLGGHNALPSIKKNMTEEEKLKIENLHLKIKFEQLKKGYLTKGVGAEKEFVTTLDVNMK